MSIATSNVKLPNPTTNPTTIIHASDYVHSCHHQERDKATCFTVEWAQLIIIMTEAGMFP